MLLAFYRHADVMKKIMKMIEEDGRLLEVHSYPVITINIAIVIFLNVLLLQISTGVSKVCTSSDTHNRIRLYSTPCSSICLTPCVV